VGFVDLHVHTSASDGRYAPAELIKRAAQAGVTVLAITDHDTVAGIEPAIMAAKSFPHFIIIPGVEINTDVPSGEAHILGYFIDYHSSELLSRLSEMRESRQDRGKRMIKKLEALGMPLSWERVSEIASTDAIGRPHIAQAMLEKGYINNLREAFEKYLGRDGPAYVERTKMSPVQATDLILRAKGLPVLAHPLSVIDSENLIKVLKAYGLVGMEVYYGSYQVPDVSRLLSLAGKYNLIPTGGSDFHGLDEKAETGLGASGVPMDSATRLINLARERNDRETGR
jgi:hypothetical protein